MKDEGGALDVAQKLVAQALALGGAFDKPWHVGHYKGVAVRSLDHPQVGLERGEGVVGDLGPGGAHPGDKRALAHAGHAHQGGVSHELHLELDPDAFDGLAQLGKGRRPAGGGHKVDVAAAADAAMADDEGLTGVGEVGHRLDGLHGLLVQGLDLGAYRHPEHQVLAVGAMHARSLAVHAALSFEVVLEAVVDK